mgnify:CR=1 FL=1
MPAYVHATDLFSLFEISPDTEAGAGALSIRSKRRGLLALHGICYEAGDAFPGGIIGKQSNLKSGHEPVYTF